jgi:hypothetical protein
MALPGSPRRSEPITVTYQRDTHRDVSWRASFVVVSGLVLSLTLRADVGIRTRDPHLGKVVELPGHKDVTLSYEPFRAGGCRLVTRVATS